MKYESEVRVNIQINIKKQRRRLNLTQKELAELLNVKNTSVSHWEVGDNSPDIETLFKMSRLFNIDINKLCGIESEFEDDEKIKLSPREKDIIVTYRTADPVGKEIIRRMVNIVK